MKKICLFCLAVLSTLCLFACGGAKQSETVKYTLAFTATTYEGGSVTGAGEYQKGESVVLKATTETGYVFEGWYNGDALISNDATCTVSIAADMTITPKWKLVEYTVGVVKNIEHAGEATGGGTYTYGTQVTLTATTNEEFVFEGWYNGDTLLCGDETYTFLPSADVQLIAKWSVKTYLVTVEKNLTDAGEVTESGSYAKGTQIALTATTNSGYVFLGWYSGDTQLSSETTYELTVADHIVVTAKWVRLGEQPTTYAVAVTKNIDEAGTIGGAGNYELNANVTLTVSTNYGYTFEGWYSGDEKRSAETSYSFSVTGDTTLTAKWEIVKYTITYVDEQGVTNTNSTSYTVETATITLTALEKEGYTFLGWQDENGETVTEIPQGSTGNKTLYAQWEENVNDPASGGWSGIV